MKRVVVVVLAFALLFTGCAADMKLTEPGAVSSTSSNEKPINKDGSKSKTIEDNGFIFKYGVGAKNVLNTFDGTFTKDLISNGTVTVPLKLSPQELNSVFDQMKAMNIMNYPDTVNEGYSTPHLTYDLTIRIEGKTKRIIWQVGLSSKSKEAERLADLVDSARKMVENKEEYKKLPAATGFYD